MGSSLKLGPLLGSLFKGAVLFCGPKYGYPNSENYRSENPARLRSHGHVGGQTPTRRDTSKILTKKQLAMTPKPHTYKPRS